MFDQVVYISCNPQTLAQNLTAVADTHDIERFAVFDQVSGTRHTDGSGCGRFHAVPGCDRQAVG